MIYGSPQDLERSIIRNCLRKFCWAALNGFLLAREWDPQEVADTLLARPAAHADFLRFQVEMKVNNTEYPDHFPREGRSPGRYHFCFFHSHNTEEEQSECDLMQTFS